MRKFSMSSGSGSDDVTAPDPDELNAFVSTVGSRVAAEATGDVSGDESTRVFAAQLKLTQATLPELSAAVKRLKNSRSFGIVRFLCMH